MKTGTFPRYVKAYWRRGRVYTYYRRAGLSQRIDGEPLSSAWYAHYARIHESFEFLPVDRTGPAWGTIDWLAATYLSSPEFTKKAAATQRGYRIYLDELRSLYGSRDFRSMPTSAVVKIRDKYAAKNPRKADHMLTMLRNLAKTARLHDVRADDPTEAVSYIYRSAGNWRAWEPEELLRFESLVTRRSIRLAYFLALYSGQRQGDILSMSWHDIKDGGINVAQEKTKARLWIPVHPTLAEVLEAAKSDRKGTIIASKENGQRYSADGFRTIWTREMAQAGLHKLTFHGLRKNAASALAEAGCTDREIQAITGHKTTAMVGLYTRDARQKHLAKAAMDKWSKSKNPPESV
ncbi:MAG: tyrosine-type recombinase/integrase [Alphaproteobacteria bacterium]